MGFVLIRAQETLTAPSPQKNGLKGSFYLTNLPDVSWECCSNPVKPEPSKNSTSSRLLLGCRVSSSRSEMVYMVLQGCG